MHLHVVKLVFFLALAAACSTGGNGDEQFVYSGFTGANLTLDGAAVITHAGLLELTNGTLRQKAHAVHPVPFRLRSGSSTSTTAVRSFSASFVFAIVCPDADACGHGIVLFVAPADHDFSAAFPSQYIGLFNGTSNGDAANNLFGVELDTDQNSEFRDIDGNHVGVDINSLTSVDSASAGYYDDAGDHGFRNLTMASHGTAMQVWVDYNGTARQISVAMAPLKMSKPSRPLLSTTYDLSTVFTMDKPYKVGFSSATGSFNSKHYVLGWSFAVDGRPAPAIDVDKLPKLPRFAPKHKPKMVEIIPPLATAAFVVVSLLLIRRRMRYSELREDWEVEFGPHRFSYKDLFHATDGFKSDNLIGVGGFGRVYKGVLPSSKLEVAVKRVSHDSKQGMREFIAEVVSIGRLQHRNLVQLLGYCRRKGELLLVYEYMSNRSLDKHLYDDGVLDWGQRFQIIKGIASALLYLHEEWEKVIVHRDIKTSNVLLDSEMNGRLGDFGLARLYDRGADPQTTHVVGTIGYLAPELGRSSKATPLTDIFAFGIFILEVTCGQRPVVQVPHEGHLVLIDWVLEHWHKGSVIETVDPKLQGNYNVDEVCLVLKLGLLCSHPLSNARPPIRQVVKYLNGDMEMPELVPTHHSFHTLALMQNQGFDSYIAPFFVLLPILLFYGFHLVLAIAAGDDHQFVFSGFSGANLTLDGTATVTADGLLELTNGSTQLKGHAFFPAPLSFRRSGNGSTVRSFSASFVFAILTTYPNLSCHGVAFVVAPSSDLSTALAQQYMGLTDIDRNGDASNHFFAAELDTMQNVEFQDINNNHVGVDINGLRSVEARSAGYYDDGNGSFHGMNLIGGDAMQAWVDYDGDVARINITIAPIDVPKPARPLISAAYNLSDVLMEPSFIGFSSSTGPINSRHYVLGWSFGMNKPAPAIEIAKLPKLPRLAPKPRSKVLEILLPLATAAFLFSLGIAVVFVVRRRRRYAELREDWEDEFGPHRFAYKDLLHATDGFNDKHVLGAGGFGRVYRGTLPKSKLEVAVKKVSHESRQGMKEFVAEVASIGRIRHRNLVQLLGYCRRKGELLLVYDYMSNGSLDRYLHYEGNRPVLDWAHRFQVIKDVASGLLYLHEKWDKVVVHRDIKASNVLLDGEMNARLGDFGLARLYDHGDDSHTTHMVGTMGYLAPELIHTGKASTLTDVFAFGIFILEVICGQRPIKQDEHGAQVLLVDWVLDQWQNGSLLDAVDPRLQGEYNVEEACLVLKLGLLCSHPSPSARPCMQKAVDYLEGDTPAPEMASTQESLKELALMRNKGFDPYIMSYHPSSTVSFGTVSDISGGR
ncbi:L-type lectin-domain containing receptor kinase SIT2-like [Oryza brachyantha]|uniref:L-type lectin-domain containing receptor kinase SIT2-like n=1 Tax=Oryza brachyantha TaxID=4533 RepID=UPI001ADCA4E5|nr:L-type lectin-domain containing receptor kinase SIT2-like [Oryza brachyantha]